MADPKGEGLRLGFDGSIRLEFHGAQVTSDAGLLAYRDLDEALALFDSVPSVLHDSRTGRNIQHDLASLLRQSLYSRLAGYEDVNDAQRLSVDPTMRRITGKLAYNLGNFLRRLVLPRRIKHWSLRTLLTKLIKIGAKVVLHSRRVTFQMAEVAVSPEVRAELLSRIDRLRWRTA